IVASGVPVISAVGHETDITISDFAADLRAATPSQAAELVVASRAELLDRVFGLRARLANALRAEIASARIRLERLEARPALAGAAAALLQSLSPLAVLDRGYAICLDPVDGRVIRGSDEVGTGDGVEVRLARGALDCTVVATRGPQEEVP